MLVVGCSSSPKSTTPPVDQTPTTTETGALPPAPGSGKVTKTNGENGITILTYESGDRVYVHEDGTCHAEYNANCGNHDGPEITTCNPPPPQQVQCPADAK